MYKGTWLASHVSCLRHCLLARARDLAADLVYLNWGTHPSGLPQIPRKTTPNFDIPLSTMNDPGLDEPAQEAAQDVENKMQAEDEQAEREEREYLDPSYVTSIVITTYSLFDLG